MSADGLNWVKATTLDDLWEGDFVDVEVAGEVVVIFHRPGGELRAFQGMCPHQEILLADGHIDFDAGTITCPAHEWQFSMESGKGINPRGCRLFQYDVRLEGDDVLIGVPTDGRLRRLRHEAEEA
jgi:toluene monooxygenase system ferredoxin subunit